LAVLSIILQVLAGLLDFIEIMMIVYGIVSLLVYFGVLKPYGRITQFVWLNLQGMFEAMLRPIRRFVPATGGFDWSFLILFFFVDVSKRVLLYYAARILIADAS
jgi:YggT family protein